MPWVSLLHVTSSHDNQDNRICLKQAVTMARFGFSVTVLGIGVDTPDFQGVQLLGLDSPRSRSARLLIRPWRLFFRSLFRRADIYQFHDVEMLPTAFVLALLGRTVVFDVHENLSAIIEQRTWLPNPLKPALSWILLRLERLCFRHFSLVITAGPGIAERYRGYAKKLLVLPNYPRLAETRVTETNTVDSAQGAFVIVSFGGIQERSGCAELVEALSLLDDGWGVRFVLGGSGANSHLHRQLQRTSGWGLVQYLGRVTREEMREWLHRASVAVVIFADMPNSREIRSNRLYEAMAAGLPVVVAGHGEWPGFVARYRCGISVDETDPSAIADAIVTLRNNPKLREEMGAGGRAAILSELNWDAHERLLQDELSSCLPHSNV